MKEREEEIALKPDKAIRFIFEQTFDTIKMRQRKYLKTNEKYTSTKQAKQRAIIEDEMLNFIFELKRMTIEAEYILKHVL